VSGTVALTGELRGALQCALELLAHDGSYPHGINLWIYEFGFLLRWIELFRICAGDNLWASRAEALARASSFRAATLSADRKHGITFGDPQYRVGGDSWCHFLIASRTGSAVAQWLGGQLLDLPHEGVDFRSIPARRRVYEFLFYDPAVGPVPPDPGLTAYEEIGQVTVCSSRTLFTMRAGPPLGSKRYASGEYGAYGHSDPASGAFLIERDGRFIASGPGPVYRRDTALHNVVTVDGRGQVGDSTVWLPDFFPPEVLVSPLEVNLTGSCATLTADNVRCRSIRSIEWNAHSRFPFRTVAHSKPLLFDLGGGIRLAFLSPMGIEWETGLMDFVPAYPNDGTRGYMVRWKARSDKVLFFWCYLFESQPVPELHTAKDNGVRLRLADGRVMRFDGRHFSSEANP
jgi:hypothetical protein